MRQKPLLLVDIDGVISLFGFVGHSHGLGLGRGGSPWAGHPEPVRPAGATEHEHQHPYDLYVYATIDGIPHVLSRAAAIHLRSLAAEFDLVWASGWEEKAEEYLPRLLDLPTGLPFLQFERGRGAGRSLDGHWKLDAIESYAGTRALAWIDDAFNDACHAWAGVRPAPTVLVQTTPAHGLTSAEAHRLTSWAQSLMSSPAGDAGSHVPQATRSR
jgi:hypothetical protein